jgi:CxxC motif-containing protein
MKIFENDPDMSFSNGSIGASALAAAFGKTASADFASARYMFESPADAGLSNRSIGAVAPAAAFGKTASAVLPQRGISMKKTELTCIRCPIGCAITVTQDDDGKVTDITGNSCPNGYKYAANEVTNPTRIVTTTVRVKGGTLPVVSVKTKGDVPKGKMFECVKAINKMEVSAPVAIGDVIVHDVAGTGVDVVATKNVAKAQA